LLRSDFFLGAGGQHGKTLYGCGSAVCETGKFPKHSDIATVVARLVDGSLGKKGTSRQTFLKGRAETRIRQDSFEGCGTNFAVADVFMAIDATT
jgi:hypothetical protein